jgi:hypothetical protein
VTPDEQFELLSDVTCLLVDGLPTGWQLVEVDYAVAGSRVTVSASVRTSAGVTEPLPAPRAVPPLLARLRAGMAGGGNRWHAVSLAVEPSLRFNARYQWEPREH